MRTATTAVMLVTLFWLTGCAARYTADVENRSETALYAGIHRTGELTSDTLLSERIEPGGRMTLGPVKSRSGRTFLWVDTRPNPGNAVLTPLEPGRTTLVIVPEEASLRVTAVEVP